MVDQRFTEAHFSPHSTRCFASFCLSVFLSLGLTTGLGVRKTPAGQQKIGEGEQRKELRSVLRHAAITRFT